MESVPHRIDSYFERQEVWDSRSPTEDQRIAATLSMVPPGIASVLDIGCGDGRLLHQAAKGIRAAVGMDLHQEPLRRLKVPPVRSSATDLPFRSSSFDLVIATEILEHLPVPTRVRAIAEFRRVARQFVLITVPFRENVAEEFCLCATCGEVFNLYGHVGSFDLDSVSDLGGGMAPQKVLTAVPIRKGRNYSLLYYLAHRLGRAYRTSESARCTRCGGCAVSARGNLLGRVARALIWKLDRTFTRVEDGWLLILFRKTEADAARAVRT